MTGSTTDEFIENKSPAVPIVIDESYIKERIAYYSELYPNALEEVMNYIVEHESHYFYKARGDKEIICKEGVNKGKPVNARGLAQITECYFPEITDKQADDVEFALNFLAKGISDGNCRMLWSTCPI